MKSVKSSAIISVFLCLIFLCQAASAQTATQKIPGKQKKIKPTMVLLRSAVIPGWGQLYNKKYIKAGLFAAGEWYLVYGISQDWKKTNRYHDAFTNATTLSEKALQFHNYTKYRDRRNLKMWILAASIFYSMFDAYVDAQLADFNQTDKSFEAYVAPIEDGGIQFGMIYNIK